MRRFDKGAGYAMGACGWCLLACMAAACGSGDEDLSCGAGTVESNGECVPVNNHDAGMAGSAGAAGAAGQGGEAGGAVVPCEQSGNCPSVPMVLISKWPDGVDGEPFEIDAREATVGEYNVFLQDVADGFVPAQTDARCSWNEGYARDEGCWTWMLDEWFYASYELGDDFPIICIDWCDAQQYCRWAGKRLCRSEPRKSHVPEEPDDGLREWMLACSGGANTTGEHPEYGQRDCSFEEPCEEYPGVFNLAGGVSEWVDSCFIDEESGDELCGLYGGGYPGVPACWESYENLRKPEDGFRCCR